MDPRISKVLHYWFSLSPSQWFHSNGEIDTQIQSLFGSLVDEARASKLDDAWPATPQGALALSLLLDQFPRHIYRYSPEAFSSDTHAMRVATNAIAQEFDKAILQVPRATFYYPLFFYLPLADVENLVVQVASVSLTDELFRSCPDDRPEKELLKNSPGLARRHHDTIAKFGRLPKRDQYLGRDTTAEEAEF